MATLLDIFISLGLPESKFQEGIKYANYLLGTEQEKAEGDFMMQCRSDACEMREGRKEHWVGRVSD